MKPGKFQPVIAVLGFKLSNIFSNIFSLEDVPEIMNKDKNIVALSKIEGKMKMSKKSSKNIIISEDFENKKIIEDLYKRSLGFLFSYNKKIKTHGLKGASFKKISSSGVKSMKRTLGKFKTVKMDKEMKKVKQLHAP